MIKIIAGCEAHGKVAVNWNAPETLNATMRRLNTCLGFRACCMDAPMALEFTGADVTVDGVVEVATLADRMDEARRHWLEEVADHAKTREQSTLLFRERAVLQEEARAAAAHISQLEEHVVSLTAEVERAAGGSVTREKLDAYAKQARALEVRLIQEKLDALTERDHAERAQEAAEIACRQLEKKAAHAHDRAEVLNAMLKTRTQDLDSADRQHARYRDFVAREMVRRPKTPKKKTAKKKRPNAPADPFDVDVAHMIKTAGKKARR